MVQTGRVRGVRPGLDAVHCANVQVARSTAAASRMADVEQVQRLAASSIKDHARLLNKAERAKAKQHAL